VVAHVIREFARPTETFVVNQVARASAYSPVVLCRRQRPDTPAWPAGTPGTRVRSLISEGRESLGARITYEYFRTMARSEREWFAGVLRNENAAVVHGHFGTDAGTDTICPDCAVCLWASGVCGSDRLLRARTSI
jgi:hypothetical protein